MPTKRRGQTVRNRSGGASGVSEGLIVARKINRLQPPRK
ncbi:unnamed protein product [Ectocarpus sp. 6 AP-2014]